MGGGEAGEGERGEEVHFWVWSFAVCIFQWLYIPIISLLFPLISISYSRIHCYVITGKQDTFE